MQKKGKAVGLDGVPTEAYIYGGVKLAVHLCLMFNLFLQHGHLPKPFMESLIIPLVKLKGGDLTDVNNYRAITISNSITKILEGVLVHHIRVDDASDSYQFGFKAGHSTGLCTNAFKSTVRYYVERGSHVFACFVDFSKAFDKVNYWKMFHKLLNDNVAVSVVSLLAYWYCNQETRVRWQCTYSSSFRIGNGTRQGGVLSPLLFSRYLRDLVMYILNSNTGCNIGGRYCNIFAYADDIVLLAPSWRALQQLINLLHTCAIEINMSCNVAKTVCMVFRPTRSRFVVAEAFPQFILDGKPLEFVNEFKYLGHVLNNDLNDDDDIKREIRNLFMRSNILIRRHGKCSIVVKRAIFQAFCMCLYDAALWQRFSSKVFNKLKSCYVKCIKIFFGYGRRDSATQMLNELNLPSFDVLFSTSVGSFQRRWTMSTNDVVLHLSSLAL